MNEELIEDGIVIKKDDNLVEIALMGGEGCEECSAKIFCSSKPDNSRILRAIDPFGVSPGDEVRVSLKGSSLFELSLILYGAPLLILIATILSVYYGLSGSEMLELKAFLSGITLTGVYFAAVYLGIKKIKSERFLPKITFVKKL